MLQQLVPQVGEHRGDEHSLTDGQASERRNSHSLFNKNEMGTGEFPVLQWDGHEIPDRCEYPRWDLPPITPPADPNEDPRPGSDDEKAAGVEVVSAQTIKRGPAVTMEEVPDEEDETAYQKWWAGQKANQRERDIQSDNDWVPTKPDASTTPHSWAWYKPFEVDWTL